jgi:hypothetical protein
MRDACWTCRSRTIQCDRSKTPCAKCDKAGLECFEKRPIRWVTGVAIRGKMRGRRFEDDRRASTKKSSVHPKQKRIASFQQMALTKNPRPSVALDAPCIQNLSSSSRFYLDYCELVTCFDRTKKSNHMPRLILSQCPYLQTIHPLRQRQ